MSFYAKYVSGIFSGGGGSGGDVVGPASATDNAVARFDGTTGKLIQNSTVIVDDAGAMSGVTTLSATGANFSGLTASRLVTTDGSKNLQSTAAGNLTAAGADGITVTSGTGATAGTSTSIQQQVATGAQNGYLSSADWTTFNGKQAAGNYITALTGDVTASGPGSVAATLATVNASPGTYAISTVTVNGKGLVTSATAASTTGSGNVVLQTSPTITTPSIGALANLTSNGLVTTSGGVGTLSVTDPSTDFLTQYFLLAGRAGGQIGYGGTGASDALSLRSTSNATKGAVIVGPQTGETTRIGPTGSITYNNPIQISVPDSSSLTNGVVIQENSASWPATTNTAGPQGFQFLPKDNGGSAQIKVVGVNNQSFLKHINGPDGTYTGYFSMGLPWGFSNANAGLTTFKVTGTTGQSVDLVQYSNQSDFSNTVSSIGSDGQFRAPAGVVGTPGFAFHGDTNNGWWAPAADTQAWSCAGAEQMRLSSAAGLVLGLAGTKTGILGVSGSTSGVVSITAAAAAGTYTLTLPTDDGAANDVLKSDGSGVLSWQSITPTTSAISASEIDWATLIRTGGLYTKTLGANTTFTFANRTAGQTIVVRLTNTASNYTVTWPTVKWTGGAAPTMTVGAKSDIYTFIYDGTDVFGSYVQNLS